MKPLQFLTRIFAKRPKQRTEFAPAPVSGRYDAVQDTDTMGRHWANADSLDADACNSLAVRKRFRERARMEIANNAHADGIVNTHANYVIGTGPRLRMQTRSIRFNQMVEADWDRWCKAVSFQHKLRLMYLAKVGDGEAVARIVYNPAIRDQVQLDIAPIECDRLTAPLMFMPAEKYIDGVTLDDYGNPVRYDILRRHPGAAWTGVTTKEEFDQVDARFIVHWFRRKRPGQHRGVTEICSSLNLYGQGRRHREAVLSAAEFAASLAGICEMGETNDGPDEAVPFSTIPIEKGMAMAGPAGAKFSQMKAEQPSTTHEMFMRQIVSEEARPLHMPYNIAACDNYKQNFSGGRLNHHTYFVSIDVERSLAEADAVDRIFDAWFEEGSKLYTAAGVGEILPTPKHAWDWPAMPNIDDNKTANARKTSLAFGGTRLGLVYAENGLDFEDELPLMAAEYGISEEEMRARLLASNLPQQSAMAPEEPDDEEEQPPANGASRFAMRN